MATNGVMLNVNERLLKYEKLFNASFEGIVNELVEEDEANSEITTAAAWLRKALQYNSFDGKKARGKMVIGTLDFLRGGHPTEEELRKAIYLGWCVEIFQAVFLIADDLMDRSEMRRGKPCWYKKVGLVAINDTFLLEQCIYKLLHKHFQNDPYLTDLYKAFHDCAYLTAMGQELDMITSDPPDGEFSLDSYTLEKYKSIVKYKTAYYSFFLPVSLGMRVAEVKDDQLYKEAETILMKLGEFFQIQDDYLDCYGDPAIMGKIGRDIEERKCSWLVVQALQKVTEEEKLVLLNNYGKEDTASVNAVKELYTKLDLCQLYKEYEKKSFEDICNLIKTKPSGFPKGLFLFLAQKIYKRQK